MPRILLILGGKNIKMEEWCKQKTHTEILESKVLFAQAYSLLHGYNTFIQPNGVKEKVFDDDNILDS